MTLSWPRSQVGIINLATRVTSLGALRLFIGRSVHARKITFAGPFEHLRLDNGLP